MTKLKHKVGVLPVMNTPPDKCPHLEISTESEGKCSCLECGLVQPTISNWGYVRSITHYKQLVKQGNPVPPIHALVREVLQKQVVKFNSKNTRDKKDDSSNESNTQSLKDYIDFLRNNQDIILPKKNRKRELIKIYGKHLRIVLEYITSLTSLTSIETCPP